MGNFIKGFLGGLASMFTREHRYLLVDDNGDARIIKVVGDTITYIEASKENKKGSE